MNTQVNLSLIEKLIPDPVIEFQSDLEDSFSGSNQGAKWLDLMAVIVDGISSWWQVSPSGQFKA
jgi:hypothetical protein